MPYPSSIDLLRAPGDAVRRLPDGMSRARWQVAIPIVVMVALMSPMMFTGRTFGIDWAGHLWLVEMQARNIEALGHPSLFIQSGLGAFYAWYAFYGGTLYSIAGGLAVISGGHDTVAYIACYGLALVMAYGGFLWLARQVGVDGWSAHAAPLLFVTSAYLLTDAYARGAWPETMAVCSIPLVVAAAGALLQDESLRRWPAVALLGAGVVLSGSHNITMLLSAIFFALLALVALIAGVDPRRLRRRRLLEIVGLLVVAAAVNMWYLLPDLAYGARSYIGAHPTPPYLPALSPDLILNPLRDSLLGTSGQLGPTPTFYVQLPTLTLLWALAALWISRERLGRGSRRLALGFSALLILILVLVVWQGVWPHLPRLLWNVQFPYRLMTYATFCVLALVLLALKHIAPGPPRRVLLGALLTIVAIESGQALHQIWATPSKVRSRAEIYTLGPSWWGHFASAGEGVFGDEFSDFSERKVVPTINGTTIALASRGPVKTGYAVSFVSPGPGTIETNVQAGSYLVSVGGATAAGRVEDGSLVVRQYVPKGQPARVTFQPARTWPIVAGRYLSLTGCVLAFTLLVWAFAGTLGSVYRRLKGSSPRMYPRA